MRRLYLYILVLALISCNTQKEMTSKSDDPMMDKAVALSHKYIITDGHVDLPYRLRVQNFKLEREFLAIPIETDKGDFDYVRAKKEAWMRPLCRSIFHQVTRRKKEKQRILADTLIDMVNGIIKAHPDKFAPGLNADQVEKNFKKKLISLPMGMENGAPIEAISDVNTSMTGVSGM